MQNSLNAECEGADRLVITRQFAAARAVVWRAFTDPDVLRDWLLGPPGWDMQMCRIDLRENGSYVWRWRDPVTGAVLGFRGTYSYVRAGARTEDTQTFHQGARDAVLGAPTRNVVVFDDIDGGTRVTTRISYADRATRDMVLDNGLTDGMELSYTRLDALLRASKQAPEGSVPAPAPEAEHFPTVMTASA
ncbi:SRPBCC domain-containing protein [Gymnodinialimonas ulvae]|uniref:SRPBCC domain-containing protein n=1 Tax=Gymnodinialimonas ulvae TaxID=3126504 RepID=UPI00309E8EC9